MKKRKYYASYTAIFWQLVLESISGSYLESELLSGTLTDGMNTIRRWFITHNICALFSENYC